jgi:hypothetical protein
VRAAGDCDLSRVEAEAVGRAGRDERECLKGFDAERMKLTASGEPRLATTRPSPSTATRWPA